MQKRNLFIMVVVLLMASFIIAACAPAATEEPTAAPEATDAPAATEVMEEGSIWVLLPDSASSPRWETDDRRFFEQAFEAAGVEYNIVNAEADARTQQTQAEQAITTGAKVILLVNLDSGSGAAIIAAARDADVKVVDYDRLTIEGPGADVYVSFDNVQVGATMGEVLEPLISAQDGTPQVVLLNGGPTDNNSTLFREGYFSYAEPHFNDGSWELVADEWVPDWDNQQALVLFEQILTAAGNNVTGVFAANDGLANGVISAFQAAGIDPGDAGIPISGQDATVGGMQHVLAGDQAMSVYKPIKAEAEAAAEAAIALLRGESLDSLTGGLTLSNGTNDIPFIALTPIGVTADNVADTVIADGFRTWEEICVGDFLQYCPEEQGGTGETGGEEMELDVDPTGQTVTFWHAMSSGANLEGITAVVDEFNASNEYGITVEQVSQGSQSDLETAVNGAIATGELPNLTQGFPNGLVLWNSLGVISPLNDLMADPNFGMSDEEVSAIFPGPISSGTLPDGSQVGIPMHQSAQVIFYNHTWAQELGFDGPPQTSEEFKEQACAAAAANLEDDDPNNDGTGGYVYFPDASMVSPWIWAFGGEYVNEAGDAYDLNNETVLEVALFFKDLFDNGCTLFTPSFPNPEFAARQALFATSSTAGIPFQRGAMEDAGNDDEWGTIAYPGPDGTQVVDAFGQMVGIVGTNPEQDLASWIFLRYLTSPETQAEWIGYTSYFPSQTTTDVGDLPEEDPIWAGALELLSLGKAEPNLAAHGAVRGQIRDAFFAILDAADEAEIQTILDDLNATAAETVADLQ
jgi:D-xylose transport system substrate-binding protein